MSQIFTSADVNSDGRLDQAEFTVFLQQMHAMQSAKGLWVNANINVEEAYGIYNRVSEGEGFSM